MRVNVTFVEQNNTFSAEFGETVPVTLAELKAGSGIKIEGGTISVDTATAVEQDNTLPVTSAAVYAVCGNIEALLGAI